MDKLNYTEYHEEICLPWKKNTKQWKIYIYTKRDPEKDKTGLKMNKWKEVFKRNKIVVVAGRPLEQTPLYIW